MTGVADVTDHEAGTDPFFSPRNDDPPGTSIPDGSAAAGPRVLLLVPARSYRAADFLLAAARMGLDLTWPATARCLSAAARSSLSTPATRTRAPSRSPRPQRTGGRRRRRGRADAAASRHGRRALGLPHNPVEAVLAAADKARQRQRWAAAGVAQPRFEIVPAPAAEDAIRPGGRGDGIPVRGQGGLAQRQPGRAARRRPRPGRRAAGADPAGPGRRGPARAEPLLVEDYLPGPELSIDGLLTGGDLTSPAVFDKPATT